MSWRYATSWLRLLPLLNFKPDTGMNPNVVLNSTTAPGTWTASQGNAGNGGCTGGADSFACATVSPFTAAPTTTGATYKWVFQLTYGSPLDPSTFSDAPIRAWFVDDAIYTTGKGTGLLSMNTDITVPAPGGVALLGLGLLMLGLFGNARRRLHAA